MLAVDRALFETVSTQIQVAGYASPEGKTSDNLVLSLRRAEAVVRAVNEAFGRDLKGAPVGLGEEPAIQKGNLDNPTDPLSTWLMIKGHKEQQAKWPEWRIVDLNVAGILVARVGASE